MRRDPERTRRALGASAFAPLALALVLLLRTAVSSVRAASDAVLEAEASSAVALTSVADGARAQALFGDRLREEARVEPGLDRPVVHGDRARAALYDADGWDVVGTATLTRRAETSFGLPPWLGLLALAASGALAYAAVRLTAPERRRVGAIVAAGALAVPVTACQLWAHGRLQALTDLRLEGAAAALRASGYGDARDATPGTIARVTGLPLLQRDLFGSVAATTLLPETAQALASSSTPPPARVEVDAVPYALRDEGAFRLSEVPLEHRHNPLAPMVAIALAGLLLAGLPASLVPLAGAPRALRRTLWAWSFLAPATVHLAIFTIGPLAFAAWLSLHRWNLVDVARPFVGIGNYVALLGDASFWRALGNTAVLTLHVPVAMTLALVFALLVHRRTRTLALVRAALFLPSITSLVAIAIVWQWILNADYGILNWLLGLVGVAPVRWLTSPRTALLSIMILSVWLVVGYQMVLFQAGLAAIPEELYEAARIDGAGLWRRFWHVTLPGLRHTLFFVLVTSVIGSFQIFGAVYVMTEGGPLGATDVAVYHIYKEAWEFLRFGNAAAQSWVLFAVIFVVTWMHFRLLERGRERERPAPTGGERGGGVRGGVRGGVGARVGAAAAAGAGVGVPSGHGVAR
jgi:multiple sugar transport system permease protein